MGDNFDLNIKNYSLEELKILLDLKVPFSENEIMENSDNIKNKIIMDEKITNEKKEDLIKFMLKVEEILKSDLKKYFHLLGNKREYITIPETTNKPDKNIRYKNWPLGAAVLYKNRKKHQIYIKITKKGEIAKWSISK